MKELPKLEANVLSKDQKKVDSWENEQAFVKPTVIKKKEEQKVLPKYEPKKIEQKLYPKEQVVIKPQEQLKV